MLSDKGWNLQDAAASSRERDWDAEQTEIGAPSGTSWRRGAVVLRQKVPACLDLVRSVALTQVWVMPVNLAPVAAFLPKPASSTGLLF